MAEKPVIEIEYCTQCRWLLRAAYFAQELLVTFENELGGVVLRPGIGGVFEVRAAEKILWSRKTENRFPEAKELKQRIAEAFFPEKDLGHSGK